MVRERILSEIKYCQRKIDEYEVQIRNIKKQIENQCNGLDKFKTMKSGFEDAKSSRLSTVNQIFSSFDNNRTAQLYAAGMKGFLTGQKAETANQGLENIARKMFAEISSNEEKVNQLQRNIRRLNNRIDDLRYELRHLPQQPKHS